MESSGRFVRGRFIQDPASPWHHPGSPITRVGSWGLPFADSLRISVPSSKKMPPLPCPLHSFEFWSSGHPVEPARFVSRPSPWLVGLSARLPPPSTAVKNTKVRARALAASQITSPRKWDHFSGPWYLNCGHVVLTRSPKLISTKTQLRWLIGLLVL